MGLDIMEQKKGQYIISSIDYFTRMAFSAWIPDKKAERIINFLEKVKTVLPIKMLITDGARENVGKKVTGWINKQGIVQHPLIIHRLTEELKDGIVHWRMD